MTPLLLPLLLFGSCSFWKDPYSVTELLNGLMDGYMANIRVGIIWIYDWIATLLIQFNQYIFYFEADQPSKK